ncbi:cytochrome c maturation protein CcmE [Halopseudomonas sabulinigri]|uniref:Cytochrome c-type biogenesis protein CcmE n=1 Tax=Halopseudomonas sabulinigri TaxID=472181 RepID=A0A1H1PLY3_9GAMM|nr:cytochrome c maturation protein CcmE [Halopseudomonas sabulinigri]SDS12100.1 cytochrome c-type biogenesis protein CcmE [Halopseudomonas sabulinigri]
MHPLRRKRLILIVLVMLGVGAAVALALSALQQNINLFYTPTQIVAGEVPDQARIRAGGMVVEGSVVRSKDSLDVRFDVSDGAHAVTIAYSGILPDLFREGQGIVALGRLDANGVLQADEVLAKHDEEYMPPEVAKAMNDAKANKAAAGEAAADAPASNY